MKTLYCLSVILLLGSLLSNAQDNIDFRPISSSPAFIWGNTNYLFSGKNVQVLDVVSSSDIKNALSHNKMKTILSGHFIGGSSSQQPELFFVFVESELRSDQVSVLGESLKNVKNFVESASSSMAIPYVTGESQIGNDIANSLATGAGKVVVATNGDSSALPSSLRRNVVTLDQLMTLSSDKSWELLNNKQLDIVVVFFDSHTSNNNLPTMDSEMLGGVAADDAYIGKLLSNVENNGAKYAALFTAQQPAAQVSYYFPSSGPVLARFEQSVQQLEASDGGCDGCLWPDNVLEGLIVIAPFLIILIIGVTCNFQIQSELKYEAEKPKKW